MVMSTRINEKSRRPNEYINFIEVLPASPVREALALKLLEALAALFRGLVKEKGLSVNRLSEYEWNSKFVGRNWNAGQVIELVLFRPNGQTLPAGSLVSTLAHEYAHCIHMNHSAAFHDTWNQFRDYAQRAMARGDWGGGFFSDGRRLADGRVINDNILLNRGALPTYVCGGANTGQAPPIRRKRGRASAGPSFSTGRQTEKKRKAGGANSAAFEGKTQGMRIDGKRILTQEEKKEISAHNAAAEKAGKIERGKEKSGSGGPLGDELKEAAAGSMYRKRANSKSAKDQRAAAAERRMRKSQCLLTTSENEEENGRYSKRESNKLEVKDDFAEPVKKETDQDRMRDMFDSLKANNEDIEDLGSAYDWYLTSCEEDKRIRMADAGSSSPVESKPLAKAKEKESSLIKGKGKGREPPCEPLFDFGDEHHGLACTSDDEVVVIVDNSFDDKPGPSSFNQITSCKRDLLSSPVLVSPPSIPHDIGVKTSAAFTNTPARGSSLATKPLRGSSKSLGMSTFEPGHLMDVSDDSRGLSGAGATHNLSRSGGNENIGIVGGRMSKGSFLELSPAVSERSLLSSGSTSAGKPAVTIFQPITTANKALVQEDAPAPISSRSSNLCPGTSVVTSSSGSNVKWGRIEEASSSRFHYSPSAVPSTSTSAASSASDVVYIGQSRVAPRPEGARLWECKICTLLNNATYLACEACLTERTFLAADGAGVALQDVVAPIIQPQLSQPQILPQAFSGFGGDGSGCGDSEGGSLSALAPGPAKWATAAAIFAQPRALERQIVPDGWTCPQPQCGYGQMAPELWMCSACGSIKPSS